MPSEARQKKIMEKLNRAQKCSILGPQNLGSGGGLGPRGPPWIRTWTPPPIGGCVDGWVGQWVGLGQMAKNLISLDLIKIIQFSLKI